MIRFIHAADIHLDSPLQGLERYEGCPVDRIRVATRDALTRLVDLCLRVQARFLVIAGDLYDGDWRDVGTGLFFLAQMARLREAGIPVYLIAGNHDAANRMTRSLPLAKHVHLFSSVSPETKVLEDIGVAIHGQSFATQSVLEDLSAGYPQPIPNMFNIGLLHTSCTGREGHERYAPCTVEGLRNRGYDYWALGHIHLREILCAKPYIGFSGNIQGRHIRECGAKGCNVVDVDDAGEVRVAFEPLDQVRWERLAVDMTGAATMSEVLDRFSVKAREAIHAAAGRLVCVRVHLRGESSLHGRLHSGLPTLVSNLRAVGIDISADDLWIEKVVVESTEERITARSHETADDAMAEVFSVLDGLRQDPSTLQQGAFDVSDVLRKIPSDLHSEFSELSERQRSQWLERARQHLIEALMPRQGEQ